MHISSKVNKKTLANDAPALMIACGLAMRGKG
jgi:Tfp pilus assembly PilM family ATPase